MPIHQHDCDNCKFLGSFKGEDLYVCPFIKTKEISTVIVRFGKEEQYSSGVCFAAWEKNTQLRTALRIAIALGYTVQAYDRDTLKRVQEDNLITPRTM